MKITDIYINGVEDSIGYACDDLVCSWKVIDTVSRKQTYAKIEVSKTEDFEDVIFMRE